MSGLCRKLVSGIGALGKGDKVEDKTLAQHLDSVCDERTFIMFLASLAKDRRNLINGSVVEVW